MKAKRNTKKQKGVIMCRCVWLPKHIGKTERQEKLKIKG